MGQYANQKTINIDLSSIEHHENIKEQWLKPLKWNPLIEAMGILTGNEFKIYMYLMKWAGGKKQYFFSPVDIAIRLDIGEDTARKAIKTLINYGYLIEKSKNIYNFNPAPAVKDVYNSKVGERALKKKKMLPENDEEIV